VNILVRRSRSLLNISGQPAQNGQDYSLKDILQVIVIAIQWDLYKKMVEENQE